MWPPGIQLGRKVLFACADSKAATPIATEVILGSTNSLLPQVMNEAELSDEMGDVLSAMVDG